MHRSAEEIQTKLPFILDSPKDNGTLKMIVRRPGINEREVMPIAQLNQKEGLVGDNWIHRGSSKTEDESSHLEMQLTLMNSRVIESITFDIDQWKLAGDQLFVDLDLSNENLPPGTHLKIGQTLIEVTSIPHNGCGKFKERFGSDALKFVNSPMGKSLHFRGVNAKVIENGEIKKGDNIYKLK